MSDPTFETVDLTALQDEGVLMAANERFFWPFGLALTWTHNEDGSASDLHVREWVYGDGHVECIELAPDDEAGQERRERFAAWADARRQAMAIADERDATRRVVAFDPAGTEDVK